MRVHHADAVNAMSVLLIARTTLAKEMLITQELERALHLHKVQHKKVDSRSTSHTTDLAHSFGSFKCTAFMFHPLVMP